MGTEHRVIEESLVDLQFECNLRACRGACCTMPGKYGAPLRPEEIPIIEKALPVVEKYLPPRHREEIRRRGFYQESGNHSSTICVNDRACVFVSYEDEIAFCAFEKAYADRQLSWRKPLSCHLFPLRVNGRGDPSLRFERIPECEPALTLGEQGGMSLIAFLEDALIRLLGNEEYAALRKMQDGNSDHSLRAASQTTELSG